MVISGPIRFRAGHVEAVSLQPAQSHLISLVRSPGYAEQLERDSLLAFTVMANGRIMACGGVIQLWDQRGMAWALISKGQPSEFIAVHRAAKLLIAECGLARVEAYVDDGFEQGLRWMDALGFEQETPFPMRRFAGDRDCYLFAKVKG